MGVVLTRVSADEHAPRRWRGDTSSRPFRIRALQESIREHLGIEIDATYLLADEVGRGRLPSAAFDRSRRENAWAVMRGHWKAGQYVLLYGSQPKDLVSRPTTRELRYALSRELEHLERHVLEGDATDPYEATYAIWNGCRILRTLATKDPVVSKRAAGAWALGHLPSRWHAAIQAAGRSYDGLESPGDRVMLATTMPPFVRMVRRHLPVAARRRSVAPRWS